MCFYLFLQLYTQVTSINTVVPPAFRAVCPGDLSVVWVLAVCSRVRGAPTPPAPHPAPHASAASQQRSSSAVGRPARRADVPLPVLHPSSSWGAPRGRLCGSWAWRYLSSGVPGPRRIGGGERGSSWCCSPRCSASAVLTPVSSDLLVTSLARGLPNLELPGLLFLVPLGKTAGILPTFFQLPFLS